METIEPNRSKKPVLGIIIPCKNEKDVLPSTVNYVLKILRHLESKGDIADKSFVSFIDDGSTDGTWEIITKLYQESPGEVKGLKLSRNFGHQNALLAGMLIFDCDCYITMDADLQDSPDVIYGMLKKYYEGFEIVYAVRSKRQSDTIFKRKTAELFYSLMNLLGVKIIRNHADFRLLTKKAIDTLKDFKEVNIFLRGIIPYMGFNSAVTYYERKIRSGGKTKYSLKKMFYFALDGITSFSIMPLRAIAVLGFLILSFSILIAFVFLIELYLGKTIRGWTSIILSLYLLNGLMIFCLGIIGEYIGKIYMEAKQRPRFIVEKKIE